MAEIIEQKFEITDPSQAAAMFGNGGEFLKLIEEGLAVEVLARGETVTLRGQPHSVTKAKEVLEDIRLIISRGDYPTIQEVRYAVRLAGEGKDARFNEWASDIVQVSYRGKRIHPRTLGQKMYVDTIRKNGIVIGIGPAGTGKTYLAVALAVAALQAKQVNRIILTRPAVEAGEKLGFLPGDLQEKVNPYLRPLYDALFDVLGVEAFQKHMEKGLIEIAPLAYMRGRTLDDSFIILDEAQNTTPEQMKMFLTRLGFGSKAVVTGDITQIDLPKGTESGLTQVTRILSGVPGIGIVYLSDRDVVRHELVQRIIKAYERYEEGQLADVTAGRDDRLAVRVGQ